VRLLADHKFNAGRLDRLVLDFGLADIVKALEAGESGQAI
jgi:hypothetical protein